MHVLESYALQNDLKIDKPFAYEKFFPLAVDKFITIDTSDLGTTALAYDHWQLVVDLIYPYLKKQGIEIVQLGDKENTPIRNCYMAIGQCNFNQKFYVLKKSLVHVCPNNESSHMASFHNKKSVILFSNNCFTSQYSPYWTETSNLETLKPTNRTKKPSFNPNENPKSINSIKPEEIAEKILNFLGIVAFAPSFKTLKIGSAFHQRRIESNLTHVLNAKKLEVASLIMRMDLNFNEDALRQQLEACPCSVITKKPLSDETLEKYHKRIVELVYYVEDDNDPEFIRKVREKSIKYLLRSRHGDEATNDFKLAYLDYGLIHQMLPKDKSDFSELKDKKNLYYKSNHFIIHDNSFYPSTAALLRRKHGSPAMNHEPHEIIDDPLFWKKKSIFTSLKKVVDLSPR